MDSFLETTVWGGAENQRSGSGPTREGQWIEMTGCYGGGRTGVARRCSAPAWFKLKLTVILTADTLVNSPFKPSSSRSLRQSSPSFALSAVLAWCRAELVNALQSVGGEGTAVTCDPLPLGDSVLGRGKFPGLRVMHRGSS